MHVTIELPDRIAEQLQLDGPDSGRRLLETVALEGYRNGELSRGQVSQLLDQSYNETLDLLHKHKLGLELTVDEYRQDVASLENFLKR